MPQRFEVVDEDCIGCGLCSERAPENFEIPAGTGLVRLHKQPDTAEEEQACLDACDYCPLGALRAGKPEPDFLPAGKTTPVNTASSRMES
ncbi:MAG: ferredoxin [bacterium]|nr:ferredoxin [bacterium]MCP5068584.1 ferredoxin [bacterium]